MKPLAKSFYRSALDALKHAHMHLTADHPLDTAQVILSLDLMLEMLMKAALLEQGMSIMQKPKRSISLHEALTALGARPHSAAVEILRERRDNVQHFATYQDSSAVLELFEAVTPFAEELAREVLGVADLLARAGIAETPTREMVYPEGETTTRVDPSGEAQRDAAYENGVLAWAQSSDPSGRLRIRYRKNGHTDWLSPPGTFEYLPRTDGSTVVAYRQSGRVIVYDLERGDRQVVTQTGGPGGVSGELIAVQGLGVADGLGGGIALVTTNGETEIVSEEGDSPVIGGDWIYWQQLIDGGVAIRRRSVNGGESETLFTGANHPSVDGPLLAFNSWPRDTTLRVVNVETMESRDLGTHMTFPSLRGNLVSALQKRGNDYDLVVVGWPDGTEILRIPRAGFPTGRGPILTDTSVVWESGERGKSVLVEQQLGVWEPGM